MSLFELSMIVLSGAVFAILCVGADDRLTGSTDKFGSSVLRVLAAIALLVVCMGTSAMIVLLCIEAIAG